MPSLRQLLGEAPKLLVLDASSACVQAGIVGEKGLGRWECAQAEAGTALFECLHRLNFQPEQVQGFVFCEGPGSILGIRTVAAALRAWQVLRSAPIWSYRSLDLLASSLKGEELSIIADARRDSWHLVHCTGSEMRRVPSAELAKLGRLATPAGFRAWSKVPENLSVENLPYVLEQLLPGTLDHDLFKACPSPDAFLHEAPSYALWTPQIHRAPQVS